MTLVNWVQIIAGALVISLAMFASTGSLKKALFALAIAAAVLYVIRVAVL